MFVILSKFSLVMYIKLYPCIIFTQQLHEELLMRVFIGIIQTILFNRAKYVSRQ